MGDANTADWCAEAYTQVHRQGGSFLPDVALLNGRPAPRGGVTEALVLDEHVGIAVGAPGSTKHRDYLPRSVANAERAYDMTGLVSGAKKARRAQPAGIVVGAEFVAGSPFLGAERVRRRHLACSLRVAGGPHARS